MSTTYWTLKVGTTEKQLADWGVSIDLSFQWTNKGKGTATLRTIESFDPASTQWSGPAVVSGLISLTHAIIYRDRISADGTPNSFSVGSIYFQGYFDDPKNVTDKGRENLIYRLHNVWCLFERNPFKQHRNQWSGWDSSHQRILSASIANGGSGYAIGDTITISGGTGTAATFTVAAVNSGAITLLVSANGGGKYTVNPATPNSPSGGSGSGLSVTLVFSRSPLLTDKVCSEIYLGENLNGAGGYTTRFSTGGQIGEVVDWINECYNPTKRGATGGRDNSQDVVQEGTIDPNTLMPVTRFNSVFCSDAILACLRWEPDAVIQIDDSTIPPTINVRKLGKWNNGTTPPTFIDYTNLTEVSVTLTSDQERQIELAPSVGRSLPGVVIYYLSYNVDGNVVIPNIVIDKYPNSVTDFLPEISSHTIVLAGSVREYVSAQIKGAPIADVLSATLATRRAWWQAHDHSLNDPNVVASSINPDLASTTIKDNGGSAVDTSVYLYELQESNLPAWLNGLIVRARVQAQIAFNRYKDSAHNVLDSKTDNRPHSKTLKLTNIAPGSYKQLASMTTAEVPPAGVAESVYRSLAASQFAGSITFADAQLRSGIGLANRLKLIGPNNTYTNLLIQQISTEPHAGYTTIVFGPSSPVDLDTWIELARATRERTTWNMPSGRGDGGVAQAESGADQGSDAPLDDTSHGIGGLIYDSALYKQI